MRSSSDAGVNAPGRANTGTWNAINAGIAMIPASAGSASVSTVPNTMSQREVLVLRDVEGLSAQVAAGGGGLVKRLRSLFGR